MLPTGLKPKCYPCELVIFNQPVSVRVEALSAAGGGSDYS